MDSIWMGRKLMAASTTLGQRFAAAATRGGPGVPVIASIAARLMHEIGLSLVLKEADTKLPFARTRGLIRLPADLDEGALTKAFGGLSALVSQYLQGLPGATPETEQFAQQAVRHAAVVTLQIRRDFLGGAYRSPVESQFGGLALLAYGPPAGEVATP